MSIRIDPVKGYRMTLQPGDMTKYTFFLYQEGDYVRILSDLDCPRFVSYPYLIDSIVDFFSINGNFPEYDLYQNWASSTMSHHLVSYAQEHSSCNPYTAIAAFCCAKVYLDMDKDQ